MAGPISDKQFSKPIRWWQWPNVLALDAALIAVGWQQWLGGVGTGAWVSLVLGLSVWLTYTGDRWLDVRRLPWERIVTVRHAFAKRWQRELLIVWCVVLVLNITLALTLLAPHKITTGIFLLVSCIAYTWAIQRAKTVDKESLVALLFTAGVAWLFLGQCMASLLGTTLIALFLLCYANCVLIAFREREIDRKMGRSSIAITRPLDRKLAFRALLIAGLLGLFLTFAAGLSSVLITLCAIALYHLGWRAKHIPVEVFRVLADGVLLLPWLVVLLRWAGL